LTISDFVNTLGDMSKQPIAKKPTNWPAAFATYCSGAPADEIAQIFDIHLPTLVDRIKDQHWAALRANLPLGENLKSNTEMASVTEIKLAAIQANRQANLKAWSRLRDYAVEIIEQLATRKLKFEKVFNGKLGVVKAECDPSSGDLVNITTMLQNISNGSYRALGDFQAQEKPGSDLSSNGQPPPPSITIILPSVIAYPRQVENESKVIDLRPVEQQAPLPGASPAIEQLKSAKAVETNPQNDASQS
jgi:hypothetical protein